MRAILRKDREIEENTIYTIEISLANENDPADTTILEVKKKVIGNYPRTMEHHRIVNDVIIEDRDLRIQKLIKDITKRRGLLQVKYLDTISSWTKYRKSYD